MYGLILMYFFGIRAVCKLMVKAWGLGIILTILVAVYLLFWSGMSFASLIGNLVIAFFIAVTLLGFLIMMQNPLSRWLERKIE